MTKRGNILANTDWITVILYLALVLAGWFTIYSASFDDPSVSMFDLSERFGKQAMWIGLALVLSFVIMIIDAKFFSAFAWWIYFFVLLVLIGVLLFGKTVAGSRSWFQIGSFAIQPAEFAKFATALALAKYLGKLNVNMALLKTKLVAITIIMFPSVLILLQNDTGSALVYFSFILVLYREGFSGIFIVLGLVIAVLFILTLLVGKLYLIVGLALLALLVIWISKKARKSYKTIILFLHYHRCLFFRCILLLKRCYNLINATELKSFWA